ncbi:hypothetical protein ACLKA7_001314 [Drosophila subpalustris]
MHAPRYNLRALRGRRLNFCEEENQIVVMANPEELAQQIRDLQQQPEDLIIRPPTTSKYGALKARLLQRFAESPESKLWCLLQGGGYTGQKPSEILAHMRRLSPDPGSESIIRSLFLSEMPRSVRPLLSVWNETDINKLAKLADTMLDAVGKSTTYAISSSPQRMPAEDHAVNAVGGSGTLNEISNSLRSLTQKFENMQKDVKRLQSSQSRDQSPNRSRNQLRSPARDQQNASSGDSDRQADTQQSTLCYFHQKFGNNARKCRLPCSRHRETLN